MLSGGLTQSAAMGTAMDAIKGLPNADRERLIAHMAVADAVCHIFGVQV
jgi:putative transport protein